MAKDEDRRNRPVGIFDSGVGGISVLRRAMECLPGERFLYYGDNAHVPYGEKSPESIRELTLRAAAILVKQDIKALVVACNTATAAGIGTLRSRYDFPVLGMEPALKPALEEGGGDVVVMATPATLHLEKFALLVDRLGDVDRVIPLPCPGLAGLIEREGPGSAAVTRAVGGFWRQVSGRSVSAVVLGCTHYSFIAADIAALAPEARIFDGSLGTALHLRRVLEEEGLLRAAPLPGPAVEFHSSDSPEKALPLFRRFMELPL